MIKGFLGKLKNYNINLAERGKDNFKRYEIFSVFVESISTEEEEGIRVAALKLFESGGMYIRDRKEGYIVGKVFDFSKSAAKARVGVTDFGHGIMGALGKNIFAIKIGKMMPSGDIGVWAEYSINKSIPRSKPIDIRVVR